MKLSTAPTPRGPSGAYELEGPSGQLYPTGDSLQSIEYVARNIPKAQGRRPRRRSAKAKEDAARVAANVGKVFPKAADLKAKAERARQLERRGRVRARPSSPSRPTPRAGRGSRPSWRACRGGRRGCKPSWRRRTAGGRAVPLSANPRLVAGGFCLRLAFLLTLWL
jgi:hypothetical protein